MLTKPKTQVAEVLYELLHSPMSRRHFFRDTGILNVPARIADLRRLGVAISCKMFRMKNKHGRMVRFGEWSIAPNDKEHAREIYERINKEENNNEQTD